MLFAGIDPGKKGGITILIEENGKLGVFDKYVMPPSKDLREFAKELKKFGKWFEDERVDVTIEEPGPDNKWGVVSSWSFANHIGMLKAIFPDARYVRPTVWQAAVTRKMPAKGPKERALKVCKQLWPHADWKRNDRCKVDHDGLVDAALIAYYGYTRYKLKRATSP